MTHVQATTNPSGWSALRPSGVWSKELVRAASPSGDDVALIRLAPRARTTFEVDDRSRFLVVNGPVEFHDGIEPVTGHVGDYVAPKSATLTVAAPGPEVFLLHLTGPALGEPSMDACAPDGWFAAGPGLWTKLFIPLPEDLSTFDERVAGLTRIEPGAASDRHPHPTAHRFLFLSGDAQDEVIHSSGTRDDTIRRAGDFVDYPTGIEHRIGSADGCLLFFVHEARTTV